MLPKSQRRFNPLIAALLVGLFWGGVWHLYADYIGAFGNQGWWGIPLVILQAPILLTAQRILLAWVYNRTKGSLLLTVLFHFCISSSAFLLSVTYPSNAVFLVWAVIIDLFWWAAAGAVILLDRGWWAAKKPEVPVSAVEPEHFLVLGGSDPNIGGASWVFLLKPLDEGHTHLVVRMRADFKMPGIITPVFHFLLEPVHFIMERKMLLNIKRLAEQTVVGQEESKAVHG